MHTPNDIKSADGLACFLNSLPVGHQRRKQTSDACILEYRWRIVRFITLIAFFRGVNVVCVISDVGSGLQFFVN
jgi:hypothetical protein